jgi:hypothetical protein
MLIDRWVEDESFRTDMRSDPVAAAERIGLKVSDEQRQYLTGIDWSLSDEELESLLSKHLGFC